MGGTMNGGNERGALRVAELIEKSAELLLERGLVDLSLRAMAQELDTSHRMLLYYFDSREQLIEAALARIQTERRAELDVLLGHVPDGSGHPRTLALLGHATSEEAAPFLRLQLEAWSMAVREPTVYGSFVDPELFWLPLLRQSLLSDGVPEGDVTVAATMLHAMLQGSFIQGRVPGSEAAFSAIDLLETVLGRVDVVGLAG